MKETCKARNRAGQRCRKYPIKGAVVCRTHGGATRHVKRKAAERLADLIDPDRLLREAARLAYSDLRDLFDANGNLLPVIKWPDHLAPAVSSIKVVKKNLVTGDGLTDDIHEVKLWDKPKNLELLFRHLGMLVDKLEVTGTETLLSKVQKARARVHSAKPTP